MKAIMRNLLSIRLLGALFLLAVFPALSCAEVPFQISYQGYLTNPSGDPVGDDDYDVVFSIYDVPEGGTALWSEARTVPVKDGVFNVILGQPPNQFDPTDFDGQRYLGVMIEADNEMTPRQPLTSVATALVSNEANNSITLNGMDSDAFLMVDGGSMTGTLELAENGLVVGSDQLVLTMGRVGIGTPTPDHELTVAGTIETTAGGVKFPDGTVQTSAAGINYRGKVLALAALMDRFEFGANFPTNIIDSVACGIGPSAKPTFSFTVSGSPMGTVVGFMGEDRISETYAYSIAVSTDNPSLNLETILGQSAELIYRSNVSVASFPGIITEFGLAAYDGREALYVARLEPDFAKLKWSVGYGPAYVDVSLADIIEAELSSAGLSGNISATGITLEDMRYNESTADFLSRLMEREGCHYHFNENSGQDIIVGNTNSSFQSLKGSLNYYGYLANPGTGAEFITTFHHKSSLLTQTFVLTGWDYIGKERISSSSSTRTGIGEKREYWADATTETADNRAQVNMEREMTRKHHYTGTSNAGMLKSGRIFTLSDNTGGGLGGSYLITGVRHLALYDDIAGCFTYCNAFTAIPSNVRFRPERKTPHPQAPQIVTALVTNINDPDGLGRIKVKFPWDVDIESRWARMISSSGHKDDNGLIYGQAFIPAVDTEVMVTFLQGNPAVPVVLGEVFNGVDLPPDPGSSVFAVGSDGDVTINSPAGITISAASSLELSSGGAASILLDTDTLDLSANTIDIDSNTGSLGLSGYNIDLGADDVIQAIAGTALELSTGGNVKIDAGNTMDINSASTMSLDGSSILLNGPGAPAARVGDSVAIPDNSDMGTVMTGSPTVLIGQ